MSQLGIEQPAAEVAVPDERYAGIAIIIPCYRVARHVADVIRSIPRHYPTVICVDDASPDDVGTAIGVLDDPRVTLVRRAENGGVGAAVKTGYAEALRRGAEICVKMDGDGQMSGEDLDALVAPLLDGSADYAKGNRFVDLRSLQRMPRTRLVGNALLSFASKLACGYWNMLDVTNGFTALRSAYLRRLDLGRVADRYFFETSMLVELNILRASTVDVEMPARYGDEQSSLRISSVATTFPVLLVRSLLRRFYWRYVIEDFNVVSICVLLGLPLFLSGAAFGTYRWLESLQTGTPATAGTVFLAALPITLGFQLLLAGLLLDVLSSPTRKRHRAPG
jgi:dolichol-phosphate mannosyltransferase